MQRQNKQGSVLPVRFRGRRISAGLSVCDSAYSLLNQECLVCVCNPLPIVDVMYKSKPEWDEYGLGQSWKQAQKGNSGMQDTTSEPVTCANVKT